MFIKHSDGKIASVIDEEELTEEEKKALEELTKQIKTSTAKEPPNTKFGS